jgi:hypothetical protein
MRKRLILVLALVSACATSVPPVEFEPAMSPRGVIGEVSVGPTSYSGAELLAVEDSGYVLLHNSRLTFAPFRNVRIARFAQIGVSYGKPGRDMYHQLRFASRFPYGISAPVKAALLQHTGQRFPDTLTIVVPP